MRAQPSMRLANIAKVFLFSTVKKYTYKFQYGAHMIPHPAKAHKGGEDAMFVSNNVLVVADGVGGWADHGVDPGLYSKKLCSIIGEKVKKDLGKYIDNPQLLLSEAVKENKEEGSTTVCMIHLHPETGNIKAYYLGDSVFSLIGQQETKVAPDQQKSFNFPYQVGSVGDDPSEGVLFELSADEIVKETMIIASDGLWDNYELNEMHRDVMENKEAKLSDVAQIIAKNSYTCSLKQNFESPFYKKAKQQGLRTSKDGKPDDITVVVARVIKQQL